jgi:Na+/melibiose symporter-like transporter
MFLGACLALMLCDAKKIIRRDGSRVIVMKNPTWKTELYGLHDTLRNEPFVLLLFPMFWASNWFYTYQGNAINGAYFNVRTRALNSFLYWFAQIVAASIIGPLLDMTYFRRTVRARGAWAVLFILTMVIWGGGWAWQKNYTRESVNQKTTHFKPWDWSHPGYAGPMFLYFFYGFYDAVWQGVIYWSVFSHLLLLSRPASPPIHPKSPSYQAH